jgi:uncharacterized repeat protein (TIGR03806 family)
VSRLSELGIFVGNVADQIPVASFVPYDVNVTLYSDNAEKLRFVHVPPGSQIQSTEDRWDVPVGTYFVKTFFYPNDARDPSLGRQLIETRFLVKTSSGFTASTYVWNADQTDAIASGGNMDVPTHWIDSGGAAHDDYFHVPGTSQCMTCHADRALGWRSRQMDMAGTWNDGTTNQISHLIAAGIVDQPPPPHVVLSNPFGTDPLDLRARSYLDANCSHCHGTGGEAASTNLFWSYEDTGPGSLPLCKPTAAVNGDNHIIVPGEPDQSEFLARMLSPNAFTRMPQGPIHDPDAEGIAVLSQWVAAMAPAGCPQ